MSDNKLSSINKYTVSNISKISTNTSITKRPYDSASSYSEKRDDKSKSFKRTLKSSTPKESSNDKSEDFTSLLSDELNNRSILDSRETSRVINTNVDNAAASNKTNPNKKTSSPELNAKLRDAMKVEVDTSKLYKKLQMLNALK